MIWLIKAIKTIDHIHTEDHKNAEALEQVLAFKLGLIKRRRSRTLRLVLLGCGLIASLLFASLMILKGAGVLG